LRRIGALSLAGLLSACGGGGGVADAGLMASGPPIAETVSFIEVTLPLTPAVPMAPHASKLSQCVWASPRSAPCTHAFLPMLYREAGGGTPTVDQIMGRVAVSHPWQAQRFRELLEQMPSDMLRLFRPITAIIISNDVRPSFYWVYTGAIHLDPQTMWLTPTERATLDTTPDFRSGFGDDLQFTMPWRYAKDDAYAYRSNPPAGESRTLTEVTYALARLLFHELAHANDFSQPAHLAAIEGYASVYDAFVRGSFIRVGDLLDIADPLASAEMYGLAGVRFYGDAATVTEQGYSPDTVAGFFAPDLASDHYNYSSNAEDTAMLFEELLVYHHFGVERDVAVTNLPTVMDPTAADYFVSWGQRGRVRDPDVRERALFVTQLLLPESHAAIQAWAATLPGPQPMVVGASWLDNLDLDTPIVKGSAKHRVAIAEPVVVAPDLE
jgi:hypothetical protein